MKKTPKIMKFGILYSLILLIVVIPTTIKAQSNNGAVIYQNWKMIGESATNYEVSARVSKCNTDSAAQLTIELFNEGAAAQIAHFNLTITDAATKEQLVKEISYYMAVGALIMPSCNSKEDQALRINIPLNWNPTTTTFSLKFIL